MSLDGLADELATSLAEAELVPGAASALVPDNFKPTVRLHISYDSQQVKMGNFLRASQVKVAPSVTFDGEVDASANASYMLLLIDPDAPTPDEPKFAFWRHWVLSGLQPLSDSQTVAHTKPALTEYLGPGPKDDSGPHRYLFLLFREPEGLDLAKEEVGGEEFVQRRSFGAAGFIDKHKLRLVAINWMRGVGDGWKGA